MKKGLGRGLNTLYGFGDEAEKAIIGDSGNQGSATEINIIKIKPNPDQPRKTFRDEELAELSESIKEFGVVQPIIVTPRGDDGDYMIVAGERRWRASQLAGLSTIPALVRKYTDFEILGIALIENVQRQNLNPIEEAMCYKRLTEEFEMTQEDLAKHIGKSRSHISNSMRVLRLDPRVLEMISEEKITMGHAKPILSIEGSDAQFDIATKMTDQGMNVRQAEDFVRRYIAQIEAGENPEELSQKEESSVTVERRNRYKVDLRDLLGTRVNIKESKSAGGGGKIEINYFSQDDLERIVDLIKNQD
ncbi:MAG: ParB/RepB/Spo0J family partition protein [Defluviitaleaceae bacterium]|nr:ParB/RepB/Spo0J family partition protein [Defluviitaleaceae bacterium]